MSVSRGEHAARWRQSGSSGAPARPPEEGRVRSHEENEENASRRQEGSLFCVPAWRDAEVPR